MKFTIYSNYNFGKLILAESIEIECEGVGTEDAPLIITPSEKIPKIFFLQGSNLYVIIRNFKSYDISLQSCLNVTFDSCKLKRCWLFKSNHITINSSSAEYVKLIRSSHIDVDGSYFERVKLIDSTDEIFFKDSTISRAQKDQINNIFFENTHVVNSYIFKPFKFIIKDNKRILLYLAILIVMVLMGIVLWLYSFPLFIFYMIFLFLFQLFYSVRQRKKVTRRKKLNK
jgi:hypothetical protein